MGGCHSRSRANSAVTAPQNFQSIKVCDESLEEAILEIPEINYGSFQRVALEWDLLGELIPYNPDGADVDLSESNPDRASEFNSLRRKLTNTKQREYFTNPNDGSADRSVQRQRTGGSIQGDQSMDSFRRAINMWTNFKVSSKAHKNLHGQTDAFCYFDSTHVPLPQELFASDGSNSIDDEGIADQLISGRSSQIAAGSSILDRSANASITSQNSVLQTKTASIVSGNLSIDAVERRPTSETDRKESLEPDVPFTDPQGPMDLLNYELVLQPYYDKENGRHSYKCIYRPRREVSPRDKGHNVEDGVVQLVGELLDPFQSHSNNQRRSQLLELLKGMQSPTGHDIDIQDTANNDMDEYPIRPVRRQTKNVVRRTMDLRSLSTFSHAPCEINEDDICIPPECLEQLEELDNGVCCRIRHNTPNSMQVASLERRRARKGRFGDMSDIPLLL
ncbi:uncharacterized protein BBOV_IV008290 [Babesia bovis T2Bo]|uniref:Uncharacterized protein n=1 Tax=Babesia bovis TaxID=5865 RepID=A7ARL4_BABBO|nr:uncharacterized protein BBOV_IV008290 [Babesia bovis T2Bo]EDO07183.1 hypothetical protein BBOV_IV008290 [Babesia bovis T2Bo]|eukprot:XP_001610751.1 hypothetical protein [Babesia bovis T2Bo]